MGGFISARVPCTVGAWALSLGISGCASPPIIDLARNTYIYQSPEYKAPRRAPAPIYVTRLRDRRQLPNTKTGASFRQIYSDDVWDRPVPVMVEEVLIEGVDRSGIYNGISSGTGSKPLATDFVLEPTLTEMYRMREAIGERGQLGQRRVVAVTSLQVRVFAPADGNGQRTKVMDETFREVVATQPSLARPEEGLALSGRSLRQIMSRMLVKLYESNIPDIEGESSDGAATEASSQTPPTKR